MSDEGRIEARGLTRRFGDKLALHPLELSVGPGGITGLLGPNGSGKSTFMRMLLGLVRPDAGAATIDGVALSGDGTAVRRRVSYMPGEIAVYGEMSGREHLLWLLRGRTAADKTRALEIADELHLPLAKRVRTFSQGMKRQLFFAAALGPDVRIRLLDEPTDGLDPSVRRRVLEILERDAEGGATVLLSSHHLAEVERACTRFLFLHEGKLLADESASDVLERYSQVVHLSFRGSAEVPAEEVFVGSGADRVRIDGTQVTAYLGELSPLTYLAQLERTECPVPSGVEYGSFKMEELYRDLYGVGGV